MTVKDAPQVSERLHSVLIATQVSNMNPSPAMQDKLFKVIHKYPLQIGTKVSFEVPTTTKAFHVGMQGGQPHVWVEKILPCADTKIMHFYVAATGEPMPYAAQYRGTVHQGHYVWHIYEVPDSF